MLWSPRDRWFNGVAHSLHFSPFYGKIATPTPLSFDVNAFHSRAVCCIGSMPPCLYSHLWIGRCWANAELARFAENCKCSDSPTWKVWVINAIRFFKRIRGLKTCTMRTHYRRRADRRLVLRVILMLAFLNSQEPPISSAIHPSTQLDTSIM